MTTSDDRVEALYEFAAANLQGFTNEQAMAALGMDLTVFNRTAQQLRSFLEDDVINLICDPGGARERWIYRLVGRIEDGSPWVRNRLKDSESRFTTMSAVVSAIVNATDGRTLEGRRARIMQKAITRLREDLSDVGEMFSDEVA